MHWYSLELSTKLKRIILSQQVAITHILHSFILVECWTRLKWQVRRTFEWIKFDNLNHFKDFIMGMYGICFIYFSRNNLSVILDFIASNWLLKFEIVNLNNFYCNLKIKFDFVFQIWLFFHFKSYQMTKNLIKNAFRSAGGFRICPD